MPTGYRPPPTDEQLEQMEKEATVRHLKAVSDYQRQQRQSEFDIPGDTPHEEKLTELNETLLSQQALGQNARRDSLAALVGASTDAPIAFTTPSSMDPEDVRQAEAALGKRIRIVPEAKRGRPKTAEASGKEIGYRLMKQLGQNYREEAAKDRYGALQNLAAEILCGGDIFVRSGLMDCSKAYHTFAEIVSLVPQKGRDEGSATEDTIDELRKLIQGGDE